MTNYKRKKRISALILVFMVFSLCVFPAFAAVNIDYDFRIDEGYVYVRVSPDQSNYKYLLASNFSIFNVSPNSLSWQWILSKDSSGTIDQSNASWWALFPFTTRQVDSRTLTLNGIDLSEISSYDAEVTVTYKIEGRGTKYVDNFVPIDIYAITPGDLTVNDIKSNIINSQQIQDTAKIKKRETTYYYDEIEEWATISYTTTSAEFNNLNDMLFLKHNASLEYLEGTTLNIITNLTIKLSYSDAQKILNLQKVNNAIVEQIKAILGEHEDEIYEAADSKIDDFESELSKAAAPEISFEVPDYSFIDYETDDFSGSDFMDVLTSCPGYMILLTLGTSLWVVKVLVFGKG